MFQRFSCFTFLFSYLPGLFQAPHLHWDVWWWPGHRSDVLLVGWRDRKIFDQQWLLRPAQRVLQACPQGQHWSFWASFNTLEFCNLRAKFQLNATATFCVPNWSLVMRLLRMVSWCALHGHNPAKANMPRWKEAREEIVEKRVPWQNPPDLPPQRIWKEGWWVDGE